MREADAHAPPPLQEREAEVCAREVLLQDQQLQAEQERAWAQQQEREQGELHGLEASRHRETMEDAGRRLAAAREERAGHEEAIERLQQQVRIEAVC